jgi:sulfate adenylyltransferase
MHRSHEYLCKIAVEVCDGVYIHSLVGNLKPGDIPGRGSRQMHRRPGQKLLRGKKRHPGRLPAGYALCRPPRRLLHAAFRQNYGCSKMIIGRDHAGVGDFYGMFEAQTIFDKIPTPEGR